MTASILIVDDESLVAMDLRLRLETRGYRVCAIAPSGEEALSLVRIHRPDLVLMDIYLGSGMTGVEVHRAIQTIQDVPVVYLTAYSDPATLDSAKAAGPFGYLLKPFDEPTLIATLEVALARHAANRTLALEERKYRSLLENAYDLITVVNAEGLILYRSPNTSRLLGHPTERSLGLNALDEIHPDDRPAVMKALMCLLEDPATDIHADLRVQHADGHFLILEVVAKNALSTPGVEGIVINSRDVTERRATEARNRELAAQMQRAQRLESLEVLAGGLAHDFNNLLLGVLGNLTLAMESLPPEAAAQARLRAAEHAGLRAADLVTQMLAFAGKGHYAFHSLDLSALVQSLTPSLGSMLPTGVRLQTDLRPDLPAVEVDETQLKQCLQALIANGAEAIAGTEGSVQVRSGSLPSVEPLGLCIGNLPEGPCVFVEVSDSGCGIPEPQLTRIFEPFFSTKFTGRGLGLASALGIARGHRGCIQVRSIVGEGSTFRVILPAASVPVPKAITPRLADQDQASPKRLLVVDDEEVVRLVASDFLELLGYPVDSATNGQEALDLLRQCPERYGLVLLDLTMPNLGGLDVLRVLKAEALDVPVLMTSGFALRDLPEDLAGHGVPFIQKPYAMAALEARVKESFKG